MIWSFFWGKGGAGDWAQRPAHATQVSAIELWLHLYHFKNTFYHPFNTFDTKVQSCNLYMIMKKHPSLFINCLIELFVLSVSLVQFRYGKQFLSLCIDSV